jgi:chemotaxis protein methyltransferase CheR
VTAAPSSATVQGPRPIGPREFRRFQEWILRETGIHLTETKQALLVGRLWKRVKELALPNYAAYLDLVEAAGEGEERVRLINAICTHETQFFREPRQFEHLEQEMIPRWRRLADEGLRSKSIRVWSAASSSGEEPYSVGMSLLAHLPASEGWSVEILATDISTNILDRARTGIYPMMRAASIPTPYLKRFMLKGRGEQAGRFAVGSELRSIVTFQQINLHEGPFREFGQFDLILCRNVLIYFTGEGRAQVLQSLTDQLAPGGRLFLGHAETLNGVSHSLRTVVPTIYGAAER